MSEHQTIATPKRGDTGSALRQLLTKSVEGPKVEWNFSEVSSYRKTGSDLTEQIEALVKAVTDLKATIETGSEVMQKNYIALVGDLDKQKARPVPADDEARKKRSAEIKRLQADAAHIANSLVSEAKSAAKRQEDAVNAPLHKLDVEKWLDTAAQLTALDVGEGMKAQKGQLANFRGWAGSIDGTRAMSSNQETQFKKLPALKKEFEDQAAVVEASKRLDAAKARLDGLLLAAAKPDDLAPNATAQDLAPLLKDREAISRQLDAAKTDDAEKAIGRLGSKIGTKRAALQQAQDKQDALHQALLDLVDPIGCKAATEQQIAAARTKVSDLLDKPATADNIAAVKASITALEDVVAVGREEIKAQQKEYGKTIDPVIRTFNKLRDAFQNLKLDGQLGTVQGDYDGIKAKQRAGDWAGAAADAKALEPKLKPITAVQDELLSFRGGPSDKLLTGTYEKLIAKLARPITLAALRNKLGEAYDKQCNVSRLNWMEFLKIAGATVKEGNDKAHYTTFNDAVMKGHAELSVKDSVDALCINLFESVEPAAQIHSTVVTNDGERYHMYWDSSFSKNVSRHRLWDSNKAAYDEMVKIHGQMQAAMRKKIQEAKASHGRIGNATAGPDV